LTFFVERDCSVGIIALLACVDVMYCILMGRQIFVL